MKRRKYFVSGLVIMFLLFNIVASNGASSMKAFAADAAGVAGAATSANDTVSASNTQANGTDALVDNMADIKDKVGESVLLYIGSSDAIVNGSKTKIDTNNGDVMPIVKDGRTLVPIRFIAESLGAQVSWDDATSTVKVKLGDSEASMALNNTQYSVNGQQMQLDVPAQIINDRTFIPLRAMAESIGKKLFWDDIGLIGISDKDNLLNTQTDGDLINRIIQIFGIYVSPNGNDNASGTYQKPFKSIKKAKDTISSLKKKTGIPKGGITVYIRGGEFNFQDSLAFVDADSGMENAPITYRAYPGEKVSFTGAYTLPADDFRPVADKNIKNRLYENVREQVMQIDLNELGIKDFGKITTSNPNTKETPSTPSLYLDGMQQTLARWPNEGFVNLGTIISQASSNDGGVFKYDEDNISRWTKAEDLWLGGYWSVDWYDDTLKVKQIDPKEKTVTLGNKTQYGISKGKRYYAFNLLEEIDSPGEWYLNRQTGILYYYPSAPLRKNSIQLSVFTKPFITMNNCSNIVIQGINFEESCYLGVLMNNSSNNLIAGCTFKNIGQAVNIKGGSNDGVSGCDIYNLDKGGVFFDAGDRAALTSSGDYVENCYITNVNRVNKTYTPAIQLTGVGIRASRNIIHDSAHTVITFTGNDNLVEGNEIYDACKESADAGAIYGGRDWTQQGNIFRGNLIHDVYGMDGKEAHGIYYDDMLSGGETTGNIFYNMFTPVFIHGGRDISVTNNIAVNCKNPFTIVNYSYAKQIEDKSSPLLPRFDAMPTSSDLWKKRYPTLWKVLDDEPTLPKYDTISGNVNFETPDIKVPDAAKPSGKFENNYTTTEDLGFVDPENNNYSLKPDSIVFQKIPGFKNITYDKMGVYIDQYRKSMPKVSDFRLVMPEDKAQNVMVNKLNFKWEQAVGATKYRLMIAEDKDFQKVVYDETTDQTSAVVKNLEYGKKTYYWKVEAICISPLIKNSNWNVDSVHSFTTMEKGYADKADLQSTFLSAKSFFDTTKEGTEPGQYPKEMRDTLKNTLDEAQNILNNQDAKQEDVDKINDKLINDKNTLVGNIVKGVLKIDSLLKDKASWLFKDANSLTIGSNSMKFTPTTNLLLGYNKVLPNYETLSFNAKFDLKTDWQGIGFRAADPSAIAWGSAGSYLIVIKSDSIELHRFYNPSKDIAVVPNTFIESGKSYNIEVGAVDVPEGVHLIFKVDGKDVFNEIDAQDYISDPGYFVLYGSKNNTLEVSTSK